MNKPTKQPVSELRDLAYRIDPALWVREQLKVNPQPWQDTFCARRSALRSSPSPRGRSARPPQRPGPLRIPRSSRPVRFL